MKHTFTDVPRRIEFAAVKKVLSLRHLISIHKFFSLYKINHESKAFAGNKAEIKFSLKNKKNDLKIFFFL